MHHGSPPSTQTFLTPDSGYDRRERVVVRGRRVKGPSVPPVGGGGGGIKFVDRVIVPDEKVDLTYFKHKNGTTTTPLSLLSTPTCYNVRRGGPGDRWSFMLLGSYSG